MSQINTKIIKILNKIKNSSSIKIKNMKNKYCKKIKLYKNF